MEKDNCKLVLKYTTKMERKLIKKANFTGLQIIMKQSMLSVQKYSPIVQWLRSSITSHLKVNLMS
jgi:hypothetical protein